MTENEQRFQAATEACVKAYSAWLTAPQTVTTREQLMESIHELRKVSSRIEIEMAIAERNTQTQAQIPIPSHRSSVARPAMSDDMGDMDDPSVQMRPRGPREGGPRDGEPRRRPSSPPRPSRPAGDE